MESSCWTLLRLGLFFAVINTAKKTPTIFVLDWTQNHGLGAMFLIEWHLAPWPQGEKGGKSMASMSRIVRHYGSNRVQGKPPSKGVVQYRFNYSTRTIVGVGYEGLGLALRFLLALPGLGQFDRRDPLLLLTLQLLVQSLLAHALHVPALPALLFLFRFRVTLREYLVVQILSFTKRTFYFTELMKSSFINRTSSLPGTCMDETEQWDVTF